MTAWSYSVLQNFQTCAKQYHEVRVLKNFRDEGSEASRWGERVHAYMAHVLKPQADGTATVDDALTMYDPIATRFSKTRGICSTELQLAISDSFNPTGWWDKDVWCRGIIDALWVNGDTARAVDWKTGKRKVDLKQLKLFALLLFAHYPEVTKINTGFVWLQTGTMDVEKYRREDITKLWQDILPDVRRFELAHKTQTWTPRPSGLCRLHCPVSTCAFWGGK